MQVSIVIGNPKAGGRTTRVAQTVCECLIQFLELEIDVQADTIELAERLRGREPIHEEPFLSLVVCGLRPWRNTLEALRHDGGRGDREVPPADRRLCPRRCL